MNRAIDHIVNNLDQPLRLEEVAGVAHFSPFHFHRIFSAAVGETLHQFVKRIRLERALYLMSHEPTRSLTDIALACGFSSSSDFSRSFKKKFGVPPSVFDLDMWRDGRRQELSQSMVDAGSPHRLERLPVGENPDQFAVRLRELPARRVAYIRVLDPYRPHVVPDAAERLVTWAEENEVIDGQWLGYMWEDPEIVPLDKCRYDVGVVVDELRRDRKVDWIDFPPMRVAEVEVKGGIDLEQRALDWLYRTWLPASQFVPDDQPCFEAWIGRPFAHGMEYFELCIQLPVKRG